MRLQSQHALREAHSMYIKRDYFVTGTTEMQIRPEMTMLQFFKVLAR